MRHLYELLFVLILSAEARSNGNSVSQREAVTKTDVVSHAFCESSLSAEEKMVKNTLEEVHTYAELKHDPRASLPESFTICSTIKTPSCPIRAYPTFFSVLDNDRAQFLAPGFKAGRTVSLLKIYYLQGTSEQVDGKIPPIFPNKWTRSCVAINTTSGLINWVVEGTVVLSTTSEEVKTSKSKPKDLSGRIVLGALSYAGLWVAPSSKVTNMNIFSSALSNEKMKNMTEGGTCLEDGDYLAWRDMEWVLHGQARMETVDAEEPCKGDPYVNLYYTWFPEMDACMHHCQNLGTRVPSVTTLKDWAKLQNSLKMDLYDKGLNTMMLWLPVHDRQTEGEWRDFYTDGAIENYTLPWVGSKPNGGTAQNCACLLNGERWGDYNCDNSHRACMCTHKPSSYLQLRGLCPNSAIDRYFKPTSYLTDSSKLHLQGLRETLITYNTEEETWVLNAKDSNVTGASRATHASFTLGKHNWTIKGDKRCNAGEPYVTELKMTGCEMGNFTCNDGQCVSMDLRCNQLPDCRDKSDERNCYILVLEDGYNKNVPPINSADPANVSVSMNVLKLVDIDEDDYSIEIQFEIIMKWKENRATYLNLKHRDSLNALMQNHFEKLWLPIVIYENTDQKETTRLGEHGNGEWDTRVIVRKEGNPTLSGPDTLDETEIFTGKDNSLVMSQIYTHAFQCAYRLSAYPFDTQVREARNRQNG